jgi:hypothetical protein
VILLGFSSCLLSYLSQFWVDWKSPVNCLRHWDTPNEAAKGPHIA